MGILIFLPRLPCRSPLKYRDRPADRTVLKLFSISLGPYMRQKELFPQKKKLDAYCQGKWAQLNLRRLSPEHVIRFCLYGQVADYKINLSLFDGLEDDQAAKQKTPKRFKRYLKKF